jgi:hypothetical protein
MKILNWFKSKPKKQESIKIDWEQPTLVHKTSEYEIWKIYFLSNPYLIVVDSNKIEYKDWCLSNNGVLSQVLINTNLYKGWKKVITHLPLDNSNKLDNLKLITFNND